MGRVCVREWHAEEQTAKETDATCEADHSWHVERDLRHPELLKLCAVSLGTLCCTPQSESNLSGRQWNESCDAQEAIIKSTKPIELPGSRFLGPPAVAAVDTKRRLLLVGAGCCRLRGALETMSMDYIHSACRTADTSGVSVAGAVISTKHWDKHVSSAL
eukprot:401220-Amphidinium_carterae.2